MCQKCYTESVRKPAAASASTAVVANTEHDQPQPDAELDQLLSTQTVNLDESGVLQPNETGTLFTNAAFGADGVWTDVEFIMSKDYFDSTLQGEDLTQSGSTGEKLSLIQPVSYTHL